MFSVDVILNCTGHLHQSIIQDQGIDMVKRITMMIMSPEKRRVININIPRKTNLNLNIKVKGGKGISNFKPFFP